MSPKMNKGKHTKQWHETHEKILEVMRKGAKTVHEIHMVTDISYYTIQRHKREMKETELCEREVT